ncbi:MAG: hypothetical protein IT461_08640 [Planctomycetes bacterium]|jgi:predicted  nucleic acid-binding Zn-ribbon protein|nr:hypothetical protein [Planctomycetota bacterium]
MSTFAQSLDLLWQLRSHDEPTVAAQKEIARAKAEVDRARVKLAAAQKESANAQAAIDKLRSAERDDEAELKRLEQRIAQLEAQSGTSTSEAQIKNVTAALAKERGHLDEIETRGLERLEQIEGAMKGLAELKKKQAVIAEELAGLERQSNAIIAAQQAIIDQHTLARAPIVAAVEEGLREQYEVANRQNPGSAICLVKPGECLGCAGELTQQHVSEVRARNKVVRCPYCRRIQDMRA